MQRSDAILRGSAIHFWFGNKIGLMMHLAKVKSLFMALQIVDIFALTCIPFDSDVCA